MLPLESRRISKSEPKTKSLEHQFERELIKSEQFRKHFVLREGHVDQQFPVGLFANWNGYLDGEDGQLVQDWFKEGEAKPCHIHTSGHASESDLRAFAAAMKPTTLVPIHGVAWSENVPGFSSIRHLSDGETMVI